MSAPVTYPRLAIRHRPVSVLVSLSPTHRGYELQPKWVLVLAKSPIDQQVVFVGRSDGIVGWAECVDYAHAAVNQGSQS